MYVSEKAKYNRHHGEFDGFIYYFTVMEQGTKRKEKPMAFEVQCYHKFNIIAQLMGWAIRFAILPQLVSRREAKIL